MDAGKFQQLTYATEMLFYEQLPSLAQHLLIDLQISLDVYTVRWFFSMFCIDLPLSYAQTVLDLFLLDQFRVLIRVSLALLSVLASQLSLAKDQEEVHAIMQNLSREEGFSQMTQSTFFNLVSSFEVPTEILYLLEHESTKGTVCDKSAHRDRVLH